MLVMRTPLSCLAVGVHMAQLLPLVCILQRGFQITALTIESKVKVNMLKYLFVYFVALRPKSTAMVMAGRSVHLTTLFPRQA